MPQHIKIHVSRKTLFEDSFQQVIDIFDQLILVYVCHHVACRKKLNIWKSICLDYELPSARSEKEIVDYFPRGGGTWLWRRGQVYYIIYRKWWLELKYVHTQ